MEDNYRKDKNLDFTEIDKMEQNMIGVEEMEEFLLNGRLIGVEGAE